METGHAVTSKRFDAGLAITGAQHYRIVGRTSGGALLVSEETGHAGEEMSMQEWVKRLREHARWTQVDLAYHLRVSPATIARWESGRAQPHALTRDALTRLARKHKFAEPMPE